MRSVRIIPEGDLWFLEGSNDLVFPGDGTIIAHDLLEHQQGIDMIGDPWDEVIALGGYMFVRGQFVYAGKGLEADLIFIFEGKENIPKPPRLRQRPCDVDWAFRDVIDKALVYEDDDAILAHMRHGWHLAKRRFGNGLVAYDLFQYIRQAVDEAEKGVPHTLSYNACKVYCKPYYGDWK